MKRFNKANTHVHVHAPYKLCEMPELYYALVTCLTVVPHHQTDSYFLAVFAVLFPLVICIILTVPFLHN